MNLTGKYFKFRIVIVIGLLVISSCSHKEPVVDKNPSASENLPLVLKLVGEKGREELAANCSQSVTKTFIKNELRHKRIENVEFQVKTSTIEVLSNSNIRQIIQTISKEGGIELHDMAYPELGESIEVIYSPDAQVKKAGKYPKSSLFFLPPIPLKNAPVKIGDTWKTENSWKSERGDLALTALIKTEFHSMKPCGVHSCAELVVNGEVHMPELIEKKNGFSHKLNGRFLLDPTRGLLVWSEFESVEHLKTGGAQVEVRSVLRSHLLEPQGYHIASHEEPSCPLESKEE